MSVSNKRSSYYKHHKSKRKCLVKPEGQQLHGRAVRDFKSTETCDKSEKDVRVISVFFHDHRVDPVVVIQGFSSLS